MQKRASEAGRTFRTAEPVPVDSECNDNRILPWSCWTPAAGRRRVSLKKLVGLVQEMLDPVADLISDVAWASYCLTLKDCLWNRHLHEYARTRSGLCPTGARERSLLDRAQAEALASLSGTGIVPREISRTWKPSAPLALITLTPGESGILNQSWARKRARNRGLWTFGASELGILLGEVGFANDRAPCYGWPLVSRAQRASAA